MTKQQRPVAPKDALMPAALVGHCPSSSSALRALTPIVGAVFTSFLVIGLAMPVIPWHVHEELGLPAFYVGLVAGAQFGASFLSRFWAGNYADTRGARRSMCLGLGLSTISGMLYYASMFLAGRPMLSKAVLLCGRGILGAGESFIVTGALIWGIARAGAHYTGLVMSWVGTAMYLAYALGAPLGTVFFGAAGFKAIALATIILPLSSVFFIMPLNPVAPLSKARPSFTKVIKSVWLPGVALAFSSVGFGAITTFVVILFAQKGWGAAWPAFSLLSIFFMLGRICFGHLPDKIGGAQIALICALIEAAGQAFIWLAWSSSLALAGAALTGLGYSLIYPGLGVEAANSAPLEQRGVAMGAYTAFLDLALGLAGPLLGLAAGFGGVDLIYGLSTLAVLCSAVIACQLSRRFAKK